MAGSRRRRIAIRAVLVVTLAVLVDPVGAVYARPVEAGDGSLVARPATPVDYAPERTVAAAEAKLAELADALDDAQVAFAQAVENYNGARVTLEQAYSAEEAAKRVAQEAGQARERARIDVGRLAAAAYRNSAGSPALSVIAHATDASLIEATSAITTAARSQNSVYTRWKQTAAEADAAAGRASERVAERVVAEFTAEEALTAARSALGVHEDAVATAEATRDTLVAELATARGVTADAERKRQREIAEAEVAERLAAASRHESDGSPLDLLGSEAAPNLGSTTPESDVADGQAGGGEAGGGEAGGGEAGGGEAGGGEAGGGEATNPPVAAPTAPAPPAPAPPAAAPPAPAPPVAAPAVASGADRAIEYAHAQLGKPYLWAGAGPDAFDCSGLTMRAWAQGGVQLSHWSVAQARQTSRISYSELRPGDLIFWSDDGTPSGTYHVALYIGGGTMIHAPSPGGYVETRDVFYWRTPSFYARVSS